MLNIKNQIETEIKLLKQALIEFATDENEIDDIIEVLIKKDRGNTVARQLAIRQCGVLLRRYGYTSTKTDEILAKITGLSNATIRLTRQNAKLEKENIQKIHQKEKS